MAIRAAVTLAVLAVVGAGDMFVSATAANALTSASLGDGSSNAIAGVVAAYDDTSSSDAVVPSGDNGFGTVSYMSTDASADDDDEQSGEHSVASLDSDLRLRLRMGFF